MHEIKIAQYRAESSVANSRANSDSNKSMSARWLKVAADWTRMAEELERLENPPNIIDPKLDGN